MTGVRTPQQDRSRLTRQRLLDATLELLCRNGAAAVTVSAVATEAGVSRGAAQHHFPTKELLIAEAVDHFFAERTAQMRHAIADVRPSSAGTDVREVVEQLFNFYGNKLYHAALHIWTAAAGDENLREIIVPAETRYGREVYHLTALALNADLADEQTRHLLGVTMDIARGLGLASVLVDNSAHRQDVLDKWAVFLDAEIRRRS